MDAEMCPHCRSHTEAVSDGAPVARVCSECAFLWAYRTGDETFKRLTISNEEAGNDAERVGGHDNPNLTGRGLWIPTRIVGFKGKLSVLNFGP